MAILVSKEIRAVYAFDYATSKLVKYYYLQD